MSGGLLRPQCCGCSKLFRENQNFVTLRLFRKRSRQFQTSLLVWYWRIYLKWSFSSRWNHSLFLLCETSVHCNCYLKNLIYTPMLSSLLILTMGGCLNSALLLSIFPLTPCNDIVLFFTVCKYFWKCQNKGTKSLQTIFIFSAENSFHGQ